MQGGYKSFTDATTLKGVPGGGSGNGKKQKVANNKTAYVGSS